MSEDTTKIASGSDRLDELVRQEFNKLKAKQGHWVDVPAWYDLTKRYHVARTNGERHNRTDGEWHEILEMGDEAYDLHANYWEIRSGWESAVKWILSNDCSDSCGD